MIASWIAGFARALTGARARWRGCEPEERQRVYFANHTSNLDFVLLWAALPTSLRRVTRPVAAQDYWRGGSAREFLAKRVFRAVLIERRRVTKDNNPLAPMLESLGAGDSLIIFPEGTRHPDGEVGAFKPGLYHLAKARPDVEFVPVFIENLNRVLPKGEILPVPILCSVNFGAPMTWRAAEGKTEFLERARSAMLDLQPA
jgi:1-acyl-sn-glycerol-3-phosphate acyltransferase